MARRAAGPNSAAALTARYYRALAADLLGRYEEALDAAQSVLDGYRRVLPQDHPNIANTGTLVAEIKAEIADGIPAGGDGSKERSSE